MSQLQALVEVNTETAAFNELASRVNGFHLEPRCRVCRNDEVRRKVNDLLATGASYAYILRTLAAENDKLDARDRVTIDSIRHHTRRHFPVQNVARATYRNILEQRAKENGVDFVNGVVTAITPLAFYETLMVRAYETLVDPATRVDVNTGMIAAARLHELTTRDPKQLRMIDLRLQMDRIVAAAQEFIPAEHHEAFLARADGRPAPTRTIEAPAPGVREFSPPAPKDEDDI